MIKFAHLSDAYRVLALLLLHSAAAWLPRRWAMALADAAGLALAMSPVGARARHAMRDLFELTAEDISKLTREWLARPFRDFVFARQIAERRQIAEDLDIESRGAPAILRDSSQSVIIAAAHFSRQAMTGIYMPSIVPKRMATVIAQVDGGVGVRGLRSKLQLGAMVAGIKRVREGDVDVVEIGRPSVVTRLLRHLKQPGGAVVIAPDASWPVAAPGGYERAFAGYTDHRFALGTARLARLSQRPIVTCVPFLDQKDRLVLEWSELIPAPARDDEAADIRISNQILDVVERAIGRRPGQYVLPLGHGRRWDAAREIWLENAESVAQGASTEVARREPAH